jgi:hypothetical protein
MADLITEATEDLQRERLKNLFDKYGLYVIALIVGTIALTGGISAYKSWDLSVKEKQTATLVAFQEAKDYPQNILKMEKIELRPAIRSIALLNAAGAFIEAKDNENALKLYERVSTDASAPREFKDLGTLMSVRFLSNNKDQNADDLIKRLEPLYARAKAPWAAHARLEAAVIEANKRNDLTKAREHLAAILDTKGLPETLYQKAEALDHVYTLQQDKSAETAKTDKKS